MLDLDKPRAATWRTIAPRMLLFHHGRNGKVDVVDLVTHEGLEDYLALFPDDRLDADPGMDWFCAQVRRIEACGPQVCWLSRVAKTRHRAVTPPRRPRRPAEGKRSPRQVP